MLCMSVLPNNPVNVLLYHAVAPMDYVSLSRHLLEFEECDTRHCMNVTVNNDVTLEKVESFSIFGFFNTYLQHFYGIINGTFGGEIKIMDDECKNLYTCSILTKHIMYRYIHISLYATPIWDTLCMMVQDFVHHCDIIVKRQNVKHRLE